MKPKPSFDTWKTALTPFTPCKYALGSEIYIFFWENASLLSSLNKVFQSNSRKCNGIINFGHHSHWQWTYQLRQLVPFDRFNYLPQPLHKPTNQNSNLHAAYISDGAQFPFWSSSCIQFETVPYDFKWH